MGAVGVLLLELCFLWPLVTGSDKYTHSDTQAKDKVCEPEIDTCEQCVKNPKCFHCISGEPRCLEYPSDSWVIPEEECPFEDIKYRQCYIGFRFISLGLSLLGLMIAIFVVTYILRCCCALGGGRYYYTTIGK